MMSHKFIHVFALSLALASSALAQDLNTQITVRHEVVPEERAVSRLAILPTVSLPSVNPGRLPIASNLFESKLSPFIATLNPAEFAASAPRYPWRGYAAVAYGPVYNLGASAGYRVVESQKVTLDAFLQFTGRKYTSEHPDAAYRSYGDVGLRNNSAAVGASLAWNPISSAVFGADILYRFSAYNFPLPVLNQGQPYSDPSLCNVNHTNLSANLPEVTLAWKHNASQKVSYGVNVGYALSKFGGLDNALAENRASAAANITYDHGDVSHWNLAVSMQLLSTSANSLSGIYNKGIISVNPSYLASGKHFSAKIGAIVSSEIGNYHLANKLRVFFYPDLSLLWKPVDAFNLYANAAGHTDANSLAALYEAQPYFFPNKENLLYYSHVYNFELGTNIGPFRGASISAFVGFDVADDWLTPAYKAGYYRQLDMNGFRFGLKAQYAFRKYLNLSAKLAYATSPDNDFKRGYYLWRDHARWDLLVNASVCPIDPLSVSLTYHMRTNRAKPLADGYQNLGDIHDLNASITYRINRQWSVFINGENLVNHHYYLGPAIPAQGIRGMLGFELKF